MNLMRRTLLMASQSRWLRERAPQHRFVRSTARRFTPGESTEDAVAAASDLARNGIAPILSRLEESVASRAEAENIMRYYFDAIERLRCLGLPAEISIKPTQLGFNLDPGFCLANLRKLAEKMQPEQTVWIDMEQSPYVDPTLDLHRRARATHKNIGVCLQAYLYRTEKDVESLISAGAAVRLVKGAYNEPPEISFARKRDVDENYFRLAQMLLGKDARRAGVRAAIATHDRALIRRIIERAASEGIEKSRLEFQMLHGIQRAEQLRLTREGCRIGVLICYGSYWFPWFMRRLAERPANLFFLARNLFSG